MNVIALIARREIITRARSRAFQIATVLLVVVLVGFAVVTSLASGGTKTYTIGVTPANEALAAPLQAYAKSIDKDVATPTVVNESTGRAQVRAGKLDALLIGDGSSVQVVVDKSLDTDLGTVLHTLAGQIALSRQITALGGNPAAIDTAVAGAPVTVVTLRPPHTYDTQRLVLGIVAGILIYLSLMLAGQSVAQGVVEEKTSRVVELLLATVRPWQLMTGKVIGIGLVGLVQIVIIGGAGVIAGLATGSLTLSGSTAAGLIVWLIVWYLLGYFAYSLAFAAVAALVSRQEDVAGVVTPVLMFVIAGYVLGVSILPSDPGNSLMATLSMIPPFAPTLMPMRIALGGVPIWQEAVAVAGILVIIPVLVWLSGRIYRNAVLRSGARVKLSEAWKAS